MTAETASKNAALLNEVELANRHPQRYQLDNGLQRILSDCRHRAFHQGMSEANGPNAMEAQFEPLWHTSKRQATVVLLPLSAIRYSKWAIRRRGWRAKFT
ncbi:hypothetical protein E4U14_003849 [Claviceps sp. LM454 group G7]|nr:hypothetical protein E4U14_003849 [Claviceps sp. LM454 group G7]